MAHRKLLRMIFTSFFVITFFSASPSKAEIKVYDANNQFLGI